MKNIYILFVILLATQALLAKVGDWQTYTNTSDIRQMAVSQNTVWSATNGGLLAFDLMSKTFQTITNSDGLTSNDLVALEIDNQNRVWAAAQDGWINIYDPLTKNVSVLNDYRGFEIENFTSYGDSVFVCLDIGVSLYDLNRDEVKETWKIGSAGHVLIDGNDIWVSLDSGIKRAKLDFPNLMAPDAWYTYNTLDGLPHRKVNFVVRFGDTLYAGTENGVASYTGFWSAHGLSGFKVFDYAVTNDTLFVATHNGVYHLDENDQWQLNPPQNSLVTGLVHVPDSGLYIGLDMRGLAHYTNQSWQSFEPNAPLSNKFSSLVIDPKGNLWATFSRPNGGVARYDGETWTNFSYINGDVPSDDYRAVAVDSIGRIWAASWGKGITRITETEDGFSLEQLDRSDGHLAGIVQDDQFVVTVDVTVDAEGNVWILNRQAADRRVIAVVTPEDEWTYFSTSDGIPSVHVTSISRDDAGRMWVATEDRGVGVIDYNDTLLDHSDDDLSQGLTTGDGLFSMHINSVASDAFGYIWIGTPEGVNYWEGGDVRAEYKVINEDINSIYVDIRNNKWFATNGGLSRLASDYVNWQDFSTDNSPLVSDNVTCVVLDGKTGFAYIGTTMGLSQYHTAYTQPAINLEKVSGYPNPFVLGVHQRFIIDKLADKAAVRFYTSDGSLVRNIPSTQILGSRAEWDGTNDRGEKVASGIYLYLVTTEEGLSAVGKVAVIKP
jgi:ligand-binding sensor domain-containing protein